MTVSSLAVETLRLNYDPLPASCFFPIFMPQKALLSQGVVDPQNFYCPALVM